MNFRIICIGSMKERYLKDAESEYFKRISRFGNINVTELRETFLSGKSGASGKRAASGKGGASAAAEIAAVVKTEGERILKALEQVSRNNNYVAALDSTGKDLSSEELADKIAELGLNGISAMTFIIGGSHGLSDEAKKSADFILSFGRKTYPHQLMRTILSEQIYRACTINAGAAYHK